MNRISIIFACALLAVFNIANAQTETTEETTTTTVTTPAAEPAPEAAAPNITSPAPSPSQVAGRPMIMTPVPSAKEEIPTPTGYVNCFTVEAGWFKNAWVPEHRVCQYEATPGQTVTYE